MKQTLRLRGALCPKTKPPINPFYTIFITFTIVLVSCVCTRAQVSASSQEAGPAAEAVSEIKPLKIGDTVPHALWDMPLEMVKAGQEGPSTVTLNDYKGKLIILDFWATWCKPCIGSLLKMDSIQKDLGSKGLIVLPVNAYDTPSKAIAAFKKRGITLPSVIDKQILNKYFPHQGIPYQVWIMGGKMAADPQDMYANSENLEKLLLGKEVKVRNEKKSVDLSKPLINEENTGEKSSILFRSSVEMGNPNLSQHKLTYSEYEQVNGLAAYNTSIDYLLYKAYESEVFEKLNRSEGSGIIWEADYEVKSTLKADRPRKDHYADLEAYQRALDEWQQSATFSYNLIIPENVDKAEALKMMREDLNRFLRTQFGIEARIEQRYHKFAVLRPLVNQEDVEELLKTKGGQSAMDLARLGKDYIVRNVNMSAFESVLGGAPELSGIPVIDSTGIAMDFRLDFKLSSSINNGLSETNLELARYGLFLKIEEWLVPVLVIGKQTENEKIAVRQ